MSEQQYIDMGAIVEDKVKVYKADPRAIMPVRASLESAAYDIHTIEGGTMAFGETKIFSTGLIMQPPEGYHIRLYARSGWGSKFNIGIPHGMGIVDRDYCGPDDVIKVVLRRAYPSSALNPEKNPERIVIDPGDRIAQITIEKTFTMNFVTIDNPPRNVSRGGFGHSGFGKEIKE